MGHRLARASSGTALGIKLSRGRALHGYRTRSSVGSAPGGVSLRSGTGGLYACEIGTGERYCVGGVEIGFS